MKKYKVIKDLINRDWKIGDIVLMDEKSATKVSDFVNEFFGDIPHKHTAITVDSVKLFNNIKI